MDFSLVRVGGKKSPAAVEPNGRCGVSESGHEHMISLKQRMKTSTELIDAKVSRNRLDADDNDLQTNATPELTPTRAEALGRY